ncbi:MAG: putative membrane protein, partial [Pirellulaceae bacterium]
MLYLKVYLAMLICFFAVDLIWLGVIAKGFYQNQLGFLLRPSPNWPVAILFYLIFLLGILVFVVAPSLHSDSWKKVALMGA